MRRNLIMVMIVVMTVCLGLSVVAYGQAEPVRALPVDAILLIDTSTSTVSTDPNNLRIQAARFLVAYLNAFSQVLSVNARVGIAQFDHEVRDTVPLRVVSGVTVSDPAVSKETRYTDFRPALDFALRELKTRSFGTDNSMAVILFTDGNPQLDDTDLGAEDRKRYFQGQTLNKDKSSLKMNDLVSQLRNAGVRVLVVAIGDADQDAVLWQALLKPEPCAAPGRYRSVKDMKELVGVYYQFATELLGRTAEQARELKPGETVTVSVPYYLDYAVFSVIKETDSAATMLMDGAGNPRRPTSEGRTSDLFEIYSIRTPPGGDWKVTVAGGNARLWVDQRLPGLELQLPSQPQVLGQPLVIGARLARGQTPVVDSAFSMNANIDKPSGRHIESGPWRKIDKDRYEVTLSNLDEAGVYTVSVAAEANGVPFFLSGGLGNFNVVPVPVIESLRVEGTLTETVPVLIKAQIRDADRLPTSQPVIARIWGSSGAMIRSVELRDDGVRPDIVSRDGQYVGETMWSASGDYEKVTVVIAGMTRDHLPFSSTNEWSLRRVVVTVIPTSLPGGAGGSAPDKSVTPTPEFEPKPFRWGWDDPLFHIRRVEFHWHEAVLVLLFLAVVGTLTFLSFWLFPRIGWPQWLCPRWDKNIESAFVDRNWGRVYDWLGKRASKLPIVGQKMQEGFELRTEYRNAQWHKRMEGLIGQANDNLNQRFDSPHKVKVLRDLLKASREDLDQWRRLNGRVAGLDSLLRAAATQDFDDCVDAGGSSKLGTPMDLFAEATADGRLWDYAKQWDPNLRTRAPGAQA